jgi:2'-5' RNA ligase
MRCFIAIDIDDKITKALGDLQGQLANRTNLEKRDVKWVRPEAIHLTLKFLGEVRDEKVVEVCNIVEDVAGRHKNFEVDVESVGRFGGRSARVLWVGAGKGNEDMMKLQKDLEERLASAGWPKENRAFTGHLTLCRIKNAKAGVKLAQASEEFRDLKLGTMPANSLSVYQSQLTPAGPIYTVLGNYKLI